VLVRSRYFVEKYDECVKYAAQALAQYPHSVKIKDLAAKAQAEVEREKSNMQMVQLINQGRDDDKLAVYRNLRAKKVKLGKVVHHLPQVVDQSITVDKKGKLHFPVLLLYDEFMQTDFI
jgi:DNA relaxase NicK